MTHFRAIMDRNISELEDACNEPLVPNPRSVEANFMLPEYGQRDYRIFRITPLLMARG